MAAHEAQHEKGRQGHRPRADRAVREASGQPGLRLFARQLHAARAGSLVHLRGHARPANGHAARQAGHGKSRADGPAGLRRRRVRQDRNRDPRGLQGRHRLEAGRRAGPHDHPRTATLPYVQRAAEGVPRPHRAPEPPQKREGDAPDSRRGQKRQDRHPDRHAQDTGQGHRVQGPRSARDRRGAEVRRGGQGEAAPAESRNRHADADRHADPPHAAVFVDGLARPVRHHDSSAQPPTHSDRDAPVR